MKTAPAKAKLQDYLKRGYVEHEGTLYPPNQVEALNIQPVKAKRQSKGKRTGWIDDHLNIRNKANKTDMFIKLIEQELKVQVYPEFFFLADRAYPFDWAIPINANDQPIKIAIEQDGGIWMKGGGAHSRPQNIERDIEKSTLASVNGWTVIRRTPDQLMTNETLQLIQKAIELKTPQP